MKGAGRELTTALIVEDDPPLRTSLARAFERRGMKTSSAASLAEARTVLASAFAQGGPDVVIVDINLSDGIALEICDELFRIVPVPLVVAISGNATAGTGFRLAQRGVRVFLEKPVREAELWAAIESAEPSDLEAVATQTVGVTGLKDAQRTLRISMVRSALRATQGNVTVAARLLGVTRQAIQQVLQHDAARRGE
jgi:ActR/RegA family two-component response regulator